jgi:hypothetical protein
MVIQCFIFNIISQYEIFVMILHLINRGTAMILIRVVLRSVDAATKGSADRFTLFHKITYSGFVTDWGLGGGVSRR